MVVETLSEMDDETSLVRIPPSTRALAEDLGQANRRVVPATRAISAFVGGFAHRASSGTQDADTSQLLPAVTRLFRPGNSDILTLGIATGVTEEIEQLLNIGNDIEQLLSTIYRLSPLIIDALDNDDNGALARQARAAGRKTADSVAVGIGQVLRQTSSAQCQIPQVRWMTNELRAQAGSDCQLFQIGRLLGPIVAELLVDIALALLSGGALLVARRFARLFQAGQRVGTRILDPVLAAVRRSTNRSDYQLELNALFSEQRTIDFSVLTNVLSGLRFSRRRFPVQSQNYVEGLMRTLISNRRLTLDQAADITREVRRLYNDAGGKLRVGRSLQDGARMESIETLFDLSLKRYHPHVDVRNGARFELDEIDRLLSDDSVRRIYLIADRARARNQPATPDIFVEYTSHRPWLDGATTQELVEVTHLTPTLRAEDFARSFRATLRQKLREGGQLQASMTLPGTGRPNGGALVIHTHLNEIEVVESALAVFERYRASYLDGLALHVRRVEVVTSNGTIAWHRNADNIFMRVTLIE